MNMERHWIWHRACEKGNNYLIYFRKEFRNSPSHEITIKIHANQFFKLYLNGKFKARGMAPSCLKSPYYNEYALTCETETFCLGIQLYGMGENIPLVTEQNKGPVSLNVEVQVGGKTYVTDASWKCCLAPEYFRDFMDSLDPMANRISAWGGYKEIYDTRFQDDSWMFVGYDDRDWCDAECCQRANELYGEPTRYDLPALEESVKIQPKIIQTDNNLGNVLINDFCVQLYADVPGAFPAVIYDFGKEVVGYPEFFVKGESGSSLSVWYGESLDMLRTDTFILNGKEQAVKPFQRRAFRYMKISANGGSCATEIKNVALILTHFPLQEKEKLLFDDPLLQKVYDTSLYTTMLASQYHFEDSVYREQMQWLLDSRIMSLVHYECFGETRLAEKAIRQFCRTQREDGSICAAGPQECNQLLPDFCLHFVMMIKEYLDYSLKQPDAEILCALEKLFAWFARNEDENGLLDIEGKVGWWCFIDWADIDKRGNVTALNCLYYQALLCYSEILLFDRDRADFYKRKANALRACINKEMFDSEKYLYCDCVSNGKKSPFCSQQSGMYALICGVAENPAKLTESLLSDSFSGVKINGAFMMCLTVDYLLDNGYISEAKTWIDRYWGEMLRRGATTWWETFDMSTPRACVPYAYSKNNATYMHEYIPVSYCHAWGAGIAFSLSKAHKRKLL